MLVRHAVGRPRMVVTTWPAPRACIEPDPVRRGRAPTRYHRSPRETQRGVDHEPPSVGEPMAQPDVLDEAVALADSLRQVRPKSLVELWPVIRITRYAYPVTWAAYRQRPGLNASTRTRGRPGASRLVSPPRAQTWPHPVQPRPTTVARSGVNSHRARLASAAEQSCSWPALLIALQEGTPGISGQARIGGTNGGDGRLRFRPRGCRVYRLSMVPPRHHRRGVA